MERFVIFNLTAHRLFEPSLSVFKVSLEYRITCNVIRLHGKTKLTAYSINDDDQSTRYFFLRCLNSINTKYDEFFEMSFLHCHVFACIHYDIYNYNFYTSTPIFSILLQNVM